MRQGEKCQLRTRSIKRTIESFVRMGFVEIWPEFSAFTISARHHGLAKGIPFAEEGISFWLEVAFTE